MAIALSWFPSGEYERAIERWERLAEDWADISHHDYCHGGATMKLWIDEDLSPALVDAARVHCLDATRNRDRGLLGSSDLVGARSGWPVLARHRVSERQRAQMGGLKPRTTARFAL